MTDRPQEAAPSVRDASMTGAELDTLVALVEVGPLWDGDVPSKTGRDGLLRKGLAVRVVVKGADGWQAATYAGRDAYKAHFDNADTIAEARAMRIARRTLHTAHHRSRK
jgi:hypothetical protein